MTNRLRPWLGIFLLIVSSVAIYCAPRKEVVRYPCIVTNLPTTHNEVLCFQADGTMFRPERRFDKFVLEVPRR